MKKESKRQLKITAGTIVFLTLVFIIVYFGVVQQTVINYSHGNDSEQHPLIYNSDYHYIYHPLNSGELVSYITIDTRGTSAGENVYTVFTYSDGTTFQTNSLVVNYLSWSTQTFNNINQNKGVNEITVYGGSHTTLQNFFYYPYTIVCPIIMSASPCVTAKEILDINGCFNSWNSSTCTTPPIPPTPSVSNFSLFLQAIGAMFKRWFTFLFGWI